MGQKDRLSLAISACSRTTQALEKVFFYRLGIVWVIDY
jgi:hypothetical protein